MGEEAVAASAKRRHILERQVVKLRGEANGLRARLDRTATLQGHTSASACACAAVAATNLVPLIEMHSSPQSHEDARAISLGLQREIVDLWEALRRSDDEAYSLREVMRQKGLVAEAVP